MDDGCIQTRKFAKQDDNFGLVFDIICKFCEMEETKYTFVCLADNVVDLWSHLTPILARAYHPDGGRAES